MTTSFAVPSPFLLKIDRSSDIGRPDFLYRYQYLARRGSCSAPAIWLLRQAGSHW